MHLQYLLTAVVLSLSTLIPVARAELQIPTSQVTSKGNLCTPYQAKRLADTFIPQVKQLLKYALRTKMSDWEYMLYFDRTADTRLDPRYASKMAQINYHRVMLRYQLILDLIEDKKSLFKKKTKYDVVAIKAHRKDIDDKDDNYCDNRDAFTLPHEREIRLCRSFFEKNSEFRPPATFRLKQEYKDDPLNKMENKCHEDYTDNIADYMSNWPALHLLRELTHLDIDKGVTPGTADCLYGPYWSVEVGGFSPWTAYNNADSYVWMAASRYMKEMCKHVKPKTFIWRQDNHEVYANECNMGIATGEWDMCRSDGSGAEKVPSLTNDGKIRVESYNYKFKDGRGFTPRYSKLVLRKPRMEKEKKEKVVFEEGRGELEPQSPRISPKQVHEPEQVKHVRFRLPEDEVASDEKTLS